MNKLNFWSLYSYGNHDKSMPFEELDEYITTILICIIIIIVSLYCIFKLLNKIKKIIECKEDNSISDNKNNIENT